jgi:hypothetical protein
MTAMCNHCNHRVTTGVVTAMAHWDAVKSGVTTVTTDKCLPNARETSQHDKQPRARIEHVYEWLQWLQASLGHWDAVAV